MNKPESSEMVPVPREPTEAMLAAADKLVDCDPQWVAKAYRAMVRVAAHPANQVLQEPVAMDFDAWMANPYTKALQKSIAEDYVPRGDLARLVAAASPQAVPLLPEQPIAEQPKPLESHLTSASGGDDLQTALPATLEDFGDDGPIQHGWQASISLDGHAGPGAYAHMPEYPEEGSVFLAAIPGLGWIPVDERSPEIGQEVLLWAEVHPHAVARAQDDERPAPASEVHMGNYRNSVYGPYLDDYAAPDDDRYVTHWMPLPPAPGESAGEVPSDKTYSPSMTPPAASLPVSAPAGQEDARDAKRYRWLRDRIDPREVKETFFYRGHNVQESVSDATDAAVDAAMSATTKES